jgi:tetratricopeptide (TPR) repeat protein
VGNKAGEATPSQYWLSLHDLGDKQQALNYYNQSLPLTRQMWAIKRRSCTLKNIGSVYDSLGDKQQALKLLQSVTTLEPASGR